MGCDSAVNLEDIHSQKLHEQELHEKELHEQEENCELYDSFLDDDDED